MGQNTVSYLQEAPVLEKRNLSAWPPWVFLIFAPKTGGDELFVVMASQKRGPLSIFTFCYAPHLST
jgi:hypothetical protein